MAGGEPGKRGLNQWIKKSGRRVNIGGKNSVQVGAGDRFVINTPGGGGYGFKTSKGVSLVEKQDRAFVPITAGTVEAVRSMGESS
jgi:5-oxoprolinase (ATP-hydrolysing)